MPRARLDGTPAQPPHRRKLTELFIKKLKPQDRTTAVWDTYQRGLCVLVQRSGHRSWKCVYTHHGRPRWYHIGNAAAVSLSDARKLAGRIMFQVAEGKDPLADRAAERSKGTFEELAAQYVEQHAKKKNKSWEQADALIRRNVLPRWGKLQAASVTRADIKAMVAGIAAPVVANQTLAAASAIFNWGMREGVVAANPCAKVERNETKPRERVLSDTELPKFWAAFDTAGLVACTALKMILLTGQRPGEVRHMRFEHVADGWWRMPGEPVPALGWPGTKNGQSHRVWLSAKVQELLAELGRELGGERLIFAGSRGAPVDNLDTAMRTICGDLKVDRATPHDLRRTFSTKVTSLGFGTDAMNRVTNHKEGGIATVYDQYKYEKENKRLMEAVSAEIVRLVDGTETSNVVQLVQA